MVNVKSLAEQIVEACEDQINRQINEAFKAGYEQGVKDSTKKRGMTNWEKVEEVFGDTFERNYTKGTIEFRDKYTYPIEWSYQVYEGAE